MMRLRQWARLWAAAAGLIYGGWRCARQDTADVQTWIDAQWGPR